MKGENMAKKVNEEEVEVIQEDLYQVASQNEIDTVVAYIEKTFIDIPYFRLFINSQMITNWNCIA